MTTRIFVYGTLKRGRENHGWISSQRFITEARTQPCYRLFDLGGYPGMVHSEDGLSIQGEIWEVDEPGLAKLDVLEDIDGGEYERVPIQLTNDHSDQPVEGYIYLHSIEGRRELGDRW